MPENSKARLIDRPDMTIAVYPGRKAIIQQHIEQSVKRRM